MSSSSSAADALFPKVRQRVLAVLFGAPDRSFYTNAPAATQTPPLMATSNSPT